jgi:hypothetical protein
MSSLRLLIRKGLSNRYGIVLLLALVSIGISFLTRVALLLYSASQLNWTFTNVLGIFFIGLLYDIAVSSFIVIPFILYVWFTSERIYSKPWMKWGVAFYIALILLFSLTQLVPAEYNTELHNGVIILSAFGSLFFY